jgi:hypothetical protein
MVMADGNLVPTAGVKVLDVWFGVMRALLFLRGRFQGSTHIRIAKNWDYGQRGGTVSRKGTLLPSPFSKLHPENLQFFEAWELDTALHHT